MRWFFVILLLFPLSFAFHPLHYLKGTLSVTLGYANGVSGPFECRLRDSYSLGEKIGSVSCSFYARGVGSDSFDFDKICPATVTLKLTRPDGTVKTTTVEAPRAVWGGCDSFVIPADFLETSQEGVYKLEVYYKVKDYNWCRSKYDDDPACSVGGYTPDCCSETGSVTYSVKGACTTKIKNLRAYSGEERYGRLCVVYYADIVRSSACGDSPYNYYVWLCEEEGCDYPGIGPHYSGTSVTLTRILVATPNYMSGSLCGLEEGKKYILYVRAAEDIAHTEFTAERLKGNYLKINIFTNVYGNNIKVGDGVALYVSGYSSCTPVVTFTFRGETHTGTAKKSSNYFYYRWDYGTVNEEGDYKATVTVSCDNLKDSKEITIKVGTGVSYDIQLESDKTTYAQGETAVISIYATLPGIDMDVYLNDDLIKTYESVTDLSDTLNVTLKKRGENVVKAVAGNYSAELHLDVVGKGNKDLEDAAGTLLPVVIVAVGGALLLSRRR